MASSKAALKAIKSSIDAGDFEKATSDAQELVKQDGKNYNAFMFLGFASEKLGRFDAAESALKTALTLKGQDIQALKGLVTLYEKQAAYKLDEYHNATHQLARIYADQEDRLQCQNLVDRYQGLAKRHGNRAQYRRALELLLPSSDIYPVLEGRVQHPSLTYKRILESSEAEESEWVKSEISARRTRLGAKFDQVTREVRAEAIEKFGVEEKYQQLIDWTIDDTTRHELEEKLLVRAYENLQNVSSDLKPLQRDKVLNTANGMVIIKHAFAMAWNIALEWVDAENLADWDISILREYTTLFPSEGLAKVIRGFLDSDNSPFPQALDTSNVDGEVKGIERLSEADQLILMSEGLEDCPQSMLAHRIMSHTYLSLQEHHSAVDLARKAQKLYLQARKTFALDLQDSLDAVNLTLANALIVFQSPRHHPEAREIFSNILKRKPTLTTALLGTGLILEEDEDYGEAARFLKQALDRDPSNLRIQLEHAWCSALDHDLQGGRQELEATLQIIQDQKQPDLLMKSEALYRIAYCMWHLDTTVAARRNRSGPYRYLIDSIKANPSYAAPYTLLGIYFLDYGRSKQRAKQALQKAFELSSSELIAAERLAKLFADSGEWDLVELVAQRVVDSGKARPAPGSKRTAISWPYAALGIVQMNRQQFSASIVSFQAALRISPHDYHSWVGLGESYHNSGRYVAAARAFKRAESLDHGLGEKESWFAKYMLANVQREVGAFDDAISAYGEVLNLAEGEFGVLIALLQTCTENAWAKISQGMFGQAIQLSIRALSVAKTIAHQRVDVFNLWKCVADACSAVGHVKAFAKNVDISMVASLLRLDLDENAVELLAEVDKVTLANLDISADASLGEAANQWLHAAILAYKRAIYTSSRDIHAQAVAWYNLGWAEHAAYTSATPNTKGGRSKKFIKAAVRSFKKAIELEASNSEFWNALGVVTMTLNQKVSQHSFVRSLHLNDHSARTWTNLGTLYLVNNDTQLANEAFTRAQSTDPEYAAAWIGQGLLATLTNNLKEARELFQHAFEIADSSSIPAKRYFAVSSFDQLLQSRQLSGTIQNLLRPLFALRQLYVQQPADDASTQLLSLYAERVDEYASGLKSLEEVCANAEQGFEKSESMELLSKFAQTKSDLARQQLSDGSHQAAIDSAEMALDLSAEDDLGPVYAERRLQWRLSAHITAALAYSRIGASDQSISMFQIALEESHHAPDIACMLAQVLWAKGGKAEKDAARTQLFNSVENHPDHILSVSLLAVIGLLDEDDDVLDAVEDDLKVLRMSDKVDVLNKIKVSKIISAISTRRSGVDPKDAAMYVVGDAMSAVMFAPGQPQGWLELAQMTEIPYIAEMALMTARNQVPPNGDLDAEELSQAYAHSGSSEDLLIAKMVAPWTINGIETVH